MPEIPLRSEDVAHELLQLRGVGKTAVALAVPHKRLVAGDGEDTAGARHKHDLAEVVAEGGEQLLRHPAGTQQPLALRAVGYADDRLAVTRHAALSFSSVASST